MEVGHIPAWKRLGLKLKFANEIASIQPADSSAERSDSKKRRTKPTNALNGSSDEAHRPKKARLHREPPPAKLSGEQVEQSTPHRDLSVRRKKSVSFAPDTKIDDGDSAQTIQFWVPDSPGLTPMKPSTKSNEDTAAEEAPKKAKREKKLKTSKQHSAPSVPRKATTALNYLHQFHRERESWKFNKNHETWLLKHALSTDRIPSTHNLALAFYLRGLKSTAAKQRLAAVSREALASNDTDVTSNVSSSEKLLDLLGDEKSGSGSDSDKLSWLEKMPRGQLILLSINEKVSVPSKSTSANGQPTPKTKKNKSRTSRIEIESSSESDDDSESESDSDDGDGPNGVRPKPRSAGNGKNGVQDDDTSSSGSSLSSSDTGSGESEEEDSDTSSDSE